MKKSNYYIGHFAEKIALIYLLCIGYWPIKINYVTGRGTGASEIDLIVRKAKTLVFVEVKKRKDLITSAEAITPKSKMRLARATNAFLQKHPKYKKYKIRFDAILFEKNFWPHHIKDAWRL